MRTIGLLGICLALAGCTNINPSLVVLGSIQPTVEEDSCVFDIEDPMFMSRPALNRANSVGLPQLDYAPIILVANHRVRRTFDLATDVSGVYLQFAQVELRDAAGTPLVFPGLPNPFRLPVSSPLVPGAADGETPGLASVSVNLVPVVYQSLLTDGTIIAEATFFGTGVDGADVESSPWTLPIDVCSGGCLFSCESDPDAEERLACRPGQDGVSRSRGFNASLGCPPAIGS